MKYYFSFICLLVFYQQGLSQPIFQDGYIITLENDTIYGAIDNRSSRINTRQCVFRDRAGNAETTYYPNDIKGYRFTGGKFFVSGIVPDGDTLFLEYLVNGIVDVYCYYDELEIHYLIDNGDGKLLALKNEEKEVTIKNGRYLIQSNEYQGVLKYVFRESPEFAQRANRVVLSHKSLINIARDYHYEVCDTGESCIVYEKKLPKVTFGPLIGFNTYTLNHFNEDAAPSHLDYMEESNFATTRYVSVGLFLRKKFFNGNDKLFAHIAASFHSIKMESNDQYYGNGDTWIIRNELSWTWKYIGMEGTLRYEFPKGKIRPVAQLGFLVDIPIKQQYYRLEEFEYERNGEVFYTHTETEPTIPLTPNYGIVAGIGGILQTRQRPFFVDLKYQKGLWVMEYFQSDHFSLTVSTTFQGQ